MPVDVYLEGLATPDKQPQYRDAYNAFLRGAADQDPNAMQSLAIMLHTGEGALEGIDKNEHRALLWYRRAGELGNAACAQKAVELSEQLQGSPNHLAAASL